MAKNNKNPKEAEPVAKCDQSKEVITNSCSGKRPIGPSGDQSKEVVANRDHLEEVITNCDNQQITKLY